MRNPLRARALGFHQLRRAECQDLYFIESQLSQEELQQLALKLFNDPVTQSVTWDEIPLKNPPPTPLEPNSVILEVALRPGVTDPVANEIIPRRMNSDFHRFIVPPPPSASCLRSMKTATSFRLPRNYRLHCWPILRSIIGGSVSSTRLFLSKLNSIDR